MRRVSTAYVVLLLYSIALTVSVLGPIMPLYVASVGIDVVGWSVLVAVQAVGMFVSEWIWGILSDGGDRRLLMIISVLSMSVLSVLFTFHQLIPLFIVLQFLTGIFFVAIGPMTRSYVAEASTKTTIGLYASMWWFFFLLGRVIGPILGGFIVQTTSFADAFWASSLISIILALFVFISFPNEKARKQKGRPSMLSALRRVGGRRSAKLLFLSTACVFMGRAMTQFYLPLYAAQQVKMNAGDVAYLFGAMSASQLVAMPVVGWLSDRIGRKLTTIFGLLISAMLFLLYFVAGTSYEFTLISIALGIGFSGSALLLAIIPDVTPTGMQGATIGVYGSFEDLGFIGSLLFGFVWTIFGPIYIFAATAITQLIGAVLVYGIKQNKAESATKTQLRIAPESV